MELLKVVGKLHKLTKGQFVCTEGEEGHSLYILLQGLAEIVLDSYSDSAKRIGVLKEGSIFGEMSLLENKPRTATIYITSPQAIIMEIGMNDFLELLEKEPWVGYKMMVTLNSRVNQMLDNIEVYDKKYVFQYKKQEMYITIQKLGEDEFTLICSQSKEYVWSILKFLSSSLDHLNQVYLQIS